jgi:hypothetical protein
MGRIDIVGRQRDAGHYADRVAFTRRREGDSGRAARRIDLHPAVAATERYVGALLEPDLFVELNRAVLIADGDDHQTDLPDPGCCAVAHFVSSHSRFGHWTAARRSTHRSRRDDFMPAKRS